MHEIPPLEHAQLLEEMPPLEHVQSMDYIPLPALERIQPLENDQVSSAVSLQMQYAASMGLQARQYYSS